MVRANRLLALGLALTALCAAGLLAVLVAGRGGARTPSSAAAVDPGSRLPGLLAPDFTLTDEQGHPVSLRTYRGRAVALAFVDARCTTICPLTTLSLQRARAALGPLAGRVQLLGVDANPDATAVSDVATYTQAHDLVGQWHFLTGRRPQLARVWRAYNVYVAAVHGNIDHQPVIYLIDPQGRERYLYLSQMAYTAIGQQADALAAGIAAVLHARAPRPSGTAPVSVLLPTQRVSLPDAAHPGRVVTLGPGRAHLVVFFASWLSQTSDLAAELRALDRYAGPAQLVLVDEAATEADPAALPSLLARVGPTAPVVLDHDGALADGYQVQDQPWVVLVTATGRVGYAHDGWVHVPTLDRVARG